MKTTFRILLGIFKWAFIAVILMFSIATFMGKSYIQTLILLLLIVSLFYWPAYFKNHWNKNVSTVARITFIVVLFIIGFFFFKPEPKTSIYISEEYQNELMQIYNQKMTDWPDDTEDIFIETKFGEVHVLACGLKENPPLVMVHAASMGAHSWAENLDPLLDHYRIYSIDNIGEGNKSELNDALIFPVNQEEIADHFAFIMDALNVKRSPVFGASNGGFIAMSYAYYHPDRVESLALFGPMGLTQLSGKSIMMLSIATMYPFQFIRDRVTQWALGDDPYILKKYGDWFNCVMKGTIPSVAMPVPMTTEQKSHMDLPVLLFLGTEDQIVGDSDVAEETARKFPGIRIEILESGHLIAVEHAEYVNNLVREFLKL